MDHSEFVRVVDVFGLCGDLFTDRADFVGVCITHPLPTESISLLSEGLEGVLVEARRTFTLLKRPRECRFGQSLDEHAGHFLLDAVGDLFGDTLLRKVGPDNAQRVFDKQRVRRPAPRNNVQRSVGVVDRFSVFTLHDARKAFQLLHGTVARTRAFEGFLYRLGRVGTRVESVVLKPEVTRTCQREVRLDLVQVEKLFIDALLDLFREFPIGRQGKVNLACQRLTQTFVLLAVELTHQVVEVVPFLSERSPVLLHGVVGLHLARVFAILLLGFGAADAGENLLQGGRANHAVKSFLLGRTVRVQPIRHGL